MKYVLIPATLIFAGFLGGCGNEQVNPVEEEQVAIVGAVAIRVATSLTGLQTAEPTTIKCSDEPTFCQALSAPELQPVPPVMGCTQQYGGPEAAHLKGRVNEMVVDLTFTRTNGCDIARYDALALQLSKLSTPLALASSESGGI